MENQINTGSLDTLKSGQTLIVNARKVNGGKIQLEFAELINDQTQTNVLGMFNQSDDRFQRRPRRGWLTAEPTDASNLLNVDLTDDSKYYNNEMDRVVMDLNILNPTIETANGSERLRLQITETITPTDWDLANLDRAAKRKGADGDFIKHNGNYIFTRSEVVVNNPSHTFLTPDVEVITGGVAANVNTDTGEIFSWGILMSSNWAKHEGVSSHVCAIVLLGHVRDDKVISLM